MEIVWNSGSFDPIAHVFSKWTSCDSGAFGPRVNQFNNRMVLFWRATDMCLLGFPCFSLGLHIKIDTTLIIIHVWGDS